MNNKTDHWQQQVGRVWASVLSNHFLKRSGTIIEIGPGFTDKIGCGLAKLQFNGVLYVLEPNKVALEWVVLRYQTLLPNATIIAVNSAMQDACALLPGAVEAILMNHVLDDMILHAGLPPAEQQSLFSQMWPGTSCHSMVKNTWQGLLNRPQYLSEIKHEVLTGLCKLIDHVDARIVGMSQYKSWFLFENELEEADLIGNQLLGEMLLKLGDITIKDEHILRGYGQDPKDWLIIERENVFAISDHTPKVNQQATKLKI